MADVRDEAVAGDHLVRELLRAADVGRLDVAAAPAHQVDVVGMGGEVIAGRAVPEVGVRDDAEFLEELQRAVHGRGAHRRRHRLHLLPDLVGRGVAEPLQSADDEPALRGRAQTARAQHRVELLGQHLRHPLSIGGAVFSPREPASAARRRASVSGTPTAAMSITQSRSPSTRPYIRVAAVYSFAVRRPHDGVGLERHPGAVDGAVVDLDVAHGVREQHLDEGPWPVGLRSGLGVLAGCGAAGRQ